MSKEIRDSKLLKKEFTNAKRAAAVAACRRDNIAAAKPYDTKTRL